MKTLQQLLKFLNRNKMDVLIFKTSVRRREQVRKVKSLFSNIPSITEWNFDMEDCDKILRIVSNNLSPRHVETMLQGVGINCEELEY